MNSAIVADQLAGKYSPLMNWKKDFVLPLFKLEEKSFIRKII